MGKHAFAAAVLLVTLGTAPAFAQEAPTAAKEKPKTGGLSGSPGAASSSYARCAPGQPIGGIVVKGGANPTKRNGGAEPECPATNPGEPAEGKGRTYTGGRRNEDAPAASVESTTVGQGASLVGGAMPSRLSMTPTTAKAAVAPPAPADKSISEKGVSASKPH